MPPGKDNQLLGIIVKSGFGNRIVPIGHGFTHNRRPCRFRVLVNIIHNQDVNGFTRQCTADTNGLEAPAMPDNFAFIGIAQPRPGNGRDIGCVQARFGENSVIFRGINDALNLSVEFAGFRRIVGHNRQSVVRTQAQKERRQTAG